MRSWSHLVPMIRIAALLAFGFPVLATTLAEPSETPSINGSVHPYEERGSMHFDAPTKKRLETLLIDVRWEKADIELVLKDVSTKCKQADRMNTPIEFILRLPQDS